MSKFDKVMKVLSDIWMVVIILLALWVFVSWIDVVADNCHPNPVHYAWNFFVVMFS